jgi:acyl-CoA thioester hydrolase
LTEPYPYHTKVRVRYNETDAQGHVNFAQYFNLFDLALVEYMRSLDYSYAQMNEAGIDMLYVDAHAAYNSPSYFDEILRLHCRIGYVGNSSVRFEFQIFADGDERLVATGEITVVMAEPGTWNKLPVPERLREAVDN